MKKLNMFFTLKITSVHAHTHANTHTYTLTHTQAPSKWHITKGFGNSQSGKSYNHIKVTDRIILTILKTDRIS